MGIDLGIAHFATPKTDSPRFLRWAEKKLKTAQRELSRKRKGAKNRAKAPLKVVLGHAAVADAPKEFHHRLPTQLIRARYDAPVGAHVLDGGLQVDDGGGRRAVAGAPGVGEGTASSARFHDDATRGPRRPPPTKARSRPRSRPPRRSRGQTPGAHGPSPSAGSG
ncbi:transposase [Streptomyces sp. NPDC059262]|uniref:transposase n=1 Tax=Streptomyces sp. NPDC059262 TaxID=3346797 RepID=UPI003696C950